MSPDALDFIRRGTNEEQSEYAAAHKTPASPTVPQGEAGPRSSDADAVGAPASEEPTWSRVSEPTGDLLDLIAEQNPATSQEIREWEHFKKVLAEIAKATGHIDQNAVRPLLRGEIKPQRIGAFYHRAAKAGLIAWTGAWQESDDLNGKNSGKPTRVYRYLGT